MTPTPSPAKQEAIPVEMMPPDWAIEKALVKFNEVHEYTKWTPAKIKVACDRSNLGFRLLVLGYASLIAQHEQEPDPIMVEAEALYASWLIDDIGGERTVDVVYAAIKRGIEIGGSK